MPNGSSRRDAHAGFGGLVLTAITIGNVLPEIAAVAQRCREFARDAGIGADVLADLQVALDEVLSNAIRYAFPDGGSHPIDVRFRASARAVEVTIEYGGIAFDPADAPPPDLRSPLGERREGGLGIHFVRQLMDETRYRRAGGRNRVTLVRQLRRQSGAAADGTS